MGKGADDQVSTQYQGPPSWALPYVKDAAQNADSIRRKRLTMSDTPLYAGMSDQRQAGLEGAYGLASQGGTGLLGAGTDYLQGVLGGDYLTAPALAQASQAGIERFMPGHNSGWELAGRSGSGLQADAMGEGVGRAVADVYGRERQMQQQAASMVPMMEQAAYDPYQRMANIGSQFEADQQRTYDEAHARHNFARDERFNRFNRATSLLSPISNMWGMEGTTTTPGQEGNMLGSVLGLAGTIGGSILGGPIGAQIGGAIGGGIGGGGPTQSAATAGRTYNPYVNQGWGGVPWT